MQETHIVQGEVTIVGTAHGAINTQVIFYEDPEYFEFKQFLTQEQLEQFATANNLIVKSKGERA